MPKLGTVETPTQDCVTGSITLPAQMPQGEP
jgi:hypothetical protein